MRRAMPESEGSSLSRDCAPATGRGALPLLPVLEGCVGGREISSSTINRSFTLSWAPMSVCETRLTARSALMLVGTPSGPAGDAPAAGAAACASLSSATTMWYSPSRSRSPLRS